MRRDVLDYAPLLEISPGLTGLGRFCIAFMASFLLLDTLLLAAGSTIPAILYQPLCFLSLGGFVAGAMSIGVAALDTRAFRAQFLLSSLAVVCVLATVFAPFFF